MAIDDKYFRIKDCIHDFLENDSTVSDRYWNIQRGTPQYIQAKTLKPMGNRWVTFMHEYGFFLLFRPEP